MLITIDGKSYKDTVDLTKERFYDLLKNIKTIPGSAAPSPYEFLKKININEENVFILTISSSLSCSYNNAIMAKNIITKKITEKTDNAIHFFDSLNASIGQGLTILKLKELLDDKLPYQEILKQINKYINETKTFFVLENMDNLINSGRINKIMVK